MPAPHPGRWAAPGRGSRAASAPVPVFSSKITSQIACEGIDFLFPDQLHDLLKPSCDLVIILPFVRELAVRAVLDALFRVAKIPAALPPEGVERTVAEQAVEILRICAFMTGKKFAVLMTEVGIFLAFPIILFHFPAPFSSALTKSFSAGFL